MPAHWTKLQSGDWGAKVIHQHPFDSVNEGDEITVTSKAGKEAQVVVEKVLWTGEDQYNEGKTSSLCAVKRV